MELALRVVGELRDHEVAVQRGGRLRREEVGGDGKRKRNTTQP